MRTRRDRDEWQAVIAAFEQSNQSVERFCAKRDIRPSTFKWWRWRLRDGGDGAPGLVAGRPSDAVRLVPVSVVGAVSQRAGAAAIEITFAEVSVRVDPGTDAAYVAALVAELRSRC